MQLRIMLLTLLIFTHNSWAFELTFRRSKTQSQKIEIQNQDGYRVNNICAKLKDKCIALNPQENKKPQHAFQFLANHPAARNCLLYQGTPIILLDDKKNEHDYCLFRDQSMIDSWDLYDKIGQEK